MNVMQKTRMTKDSAKDQDQVDYVYVGGGEGEYGEGMKIDNTIQYKSESSYSSLC